MRYLYTLFVLTLIAGPMIAEAAVAPAQHKKCVNCHNDRRNIRIIKDISAVCLGCHPANTKDHKLDVVSNTAPTVLPLVNGKITCNTCHDPHGKKSTKTLLRMETETLCRSCHPAK